MACVAGSITGVPVIPNGLILPQPSSAQRIIISHSQVNWVKWLCLALQAVCALLAIAMVHSDDRLASAITMGLFGIGVAASLLLILAHDRPFTGELSVRPDPLLQVMPELESSQQGIKP